MQYLAVSSGEHRQWQKQKRAARSVLMSNMTTKRNSALIIPRGGLVTPETDKDTGKKTYAYDPHLDPQLVWARKAERMSFEISTVSLHVHERIDPRSIIEAVRKKNGSSYQQMSLFNSREKPAYP
jgi:hypothetical protein